MMKSKTDGSDMGSRPTTTGIVDADDHQAHRGHGLMMMFWCIPMVAIAVALAITGVLSSGFLVFAVICAAMMVLMMRGMSGGN